MGQQEERQAEESLEELISFIEKKAEERLRKYIKPRFGDYILILSIDRDEKNNLRVSADLELRSSLLNNEVLNDIADEVIEVIEKSSDEVIRLSKGLRGSERGRKEQ